VLLLPDELVLLLHGEPLLPLHIYELALLVHIGALALLVLLLRAHEQHDVLVERNDGDSLLQLLLLLLLQIKLMHS
jgi:hypothetical protein